MEASPFLEASPFFGGNTNDMEKHLKEKEKGQGTVDNFSLISLGVVVTRALLFVSSKWQKNIYKISQNQQTLVV